MASAPTQTTGVCLTVIIARAVPILKHPRKDRYRIGAYSLRELGDLDDIEPSLAGLAICDVRWGPLEGRGSSYPCGA